MKNVKYLIGVVLILPMIAWAFSWTDLWQTKDQQGAQLIQSGKAKEAALVFADKNWQAVSHYRSGNYGQAYKQFSEDKSSDGLYNSGNALALMGRYQDAIYAYNKAIALNSNNRDAITNREIVKKLLDQEKNKKIDKQKQSSCKNKNQRQNQDKKQNHQKQDQKNDEKQEQNKNQNQDQKNKSNQNQMQNQQGNDAKQNQDKEQQNQDNKQTQRDDQKENTNKEHSNTLNAVKNDEKLRKIDKTQKKINTSSVVSSEQQSQDENSKQILRRLADDPGGLLKQKFLRDYLRKKHIDENRD